MHPKIISVSQITDQIKQLLESSFVALGIEGEVTGLSSSVSGHIYFSLMDKDSSLSVALFKMDALRNPTIRQVKNGDRIVCYGSLSLYNKRGTYQLIARKIELAGTGQLLQQIETTKAKLAAEGLFDLARKRPIPQFPRKIGVITSPEGAAIQDFLQVFKRRSLFMDVVVIPALVQGERAVPSLLKALAMAQFAQRFDLLVITRGGGSLEDLMPFYSEELARAIAECTLPVVTAIGHERDFSLADFVSDHRAETPTAAAEFLSEGQWRLRDRFTSLKGRLLQISMRLSERVRYQMVHAHPRMLLDRIWARVAAQNRLLARFQGVLAQGPALLNYYQRWREFDDVTGRLIAQSERWMTQKSVRLEQLQGLLEALDPQRILERGYLILQDEQGALIKSVQAFHQCPAERPLALKFHDGIGTVVKRDMGGAKQ